MNNAKEAPLLLLFAEASSSYLSSSLPASCHPDPRGEKEKEDANNLGGGTEGLV